MIWRMLAILQLVPVHFLSPFCTSGSSWFMHCWSRAWRILSITLLACEMSTIVVWTFFDIALLWDWHENWTFPALKPCYGIIISSSSEENIKDWHLVKFWLTQSQGKVKEKSRKQDLLGYQTLQYITMKNNVKGLPWWLSDRECTCSCRRHGGFHMPWRN